MITSPITRTLALVGRIQFGTTFLSTSVSGRCPDLGMTRGRALTGQLTPALTSPEREDTLQMMIYPKTHQNRRQARAHGEVFLGVEKPHCLPRGILRCPFRAPLLSQATARAQDLWMVERWQQGLLAEKASRLFWGTCRPLTTTTCTSSRHRPSSSRSRSHPRSSRRRSRLPPRAPPL